MTTKLERYGQQLIKVQAQYGTLTRKRLHLAERGGRLLRAMRSEVKRTGQHWVEWLHSDEGRRIIRVSQRTVYNWMQAARDWPLIQAMLADNPLLIDLGLEDTLKLLRHRRGREGRVKDLTPDEAQELLALPPSKPSAQINHDAVELLPLADYRIECCTVAELGERAGLEQDSLDLAFADAPWEKKSLPLYKDIGAFAQRYLKPGRLLLCPCGALYIGEAIKRLEAEGLTNPSMHKQPHLNGFKMRNGWRPIPVFSKGKFEPLFWCDDSQDGLGPEKADDPWQFNVDEMLYWIHRLTLPSQLVASLCGGVFSEAVACRRLGRRFVGCDPSRRKCAIGRERLEAVTTLYQGTLYTRHRG
jgi:hypothetical protein